MFSFSERQSIFISPLGGTEPFRPRDTVHARGHLNKVIKYLESRSFSNESIAAFKKKQVDLIQEYLSLIESIENIANNGNTILLENLVERFRALSSDPLSKWLDGAAVDWMALPDNEAGFQLLIKLQSFYLSVEAAAANRANTKEEISEINRRSEQVEIQFQNMLITLKEQVNAFEGKKNTLDAIIAESNVLIDELEKTSRDKINNFIKEADADIASFNDKYEEQTRLGASSELWLKKSRQHRAAAKAWLFVFCIITTSFVLVGAKAFDIIKNDFQWFFFVQGVGGSTATFNYGSIIMLTLIGALIFWPLRHISRLFLDNWSLQQDAEQRHAMLRTYLAIVGDPKVGVTKEERILALNALFRPSIQSGTEDALPTTLIEHFSKLLDSKR